LGGVEKGGDERDEVGGEVLPHNAIGGGGHCDWAELVRGGGGESFGDEGDVGGRKGGGEAGGGRGRYKEIGPPLG